MTQTPLPFDETTRRTSPRRRRRSQPALAKQRQPREGRRPGQPPKRQPKHGRPYSFKYTAAGTPRRYLLSGIPAQLWIRARARAKRDHRAMRQVILQLLEDWLLTGEPARPAPPPRSYAEIEALAKAAVTPEVRRELARKAGETARRQAARSRARDRDH